MTKPIELLTEQCVQHLTARGVARGAIRTRFVPGRIEILGKHTDYCGGRSMICAIDRGFAFAYAPRTDEAIHLDAVQMGAAATFSLRESIEPVMGHWTNYPMTAVRRIARNFGGDAEPLRGVDIAFASNLPAAAGMSSSSGLIVAMFLILDDVNALRTRDCFTNAIRTPEQLAEYLGTIENGQSYGSLVGDAGVGTFGGSEDHTAILLGREDAVSVYGFSPLRHERDIALPPGHMLAVAVSGVIAEKTGAARQKYNDVSLRVRALLQLWNARHATAPANTLAAAVRSAPDAAEELAALATATSSASYSPKELRDRLAHFIAESERIIPAAADALHRGDLEAFGLEVERSQEGAEKLLGNQIPQTTLLAREARSLGAVAASAFGAGFGGSVWALVETAAAYAFLEQWQERYVARFPEQAAAASFFLTRPSAGAFRP